MKPNHVSEITLSWISQLRWFLFFFFICLFLDLINVSPYDEGWIYKMEVPNEDAFSRLMDEKQYEKFIQIQQTGGTTNWRTDIFDVEIYSSFMNWWKKWKIIREFG